MNRLPRLIAIYHAITTPRYPPRSEFALHRARMYLLLVLIFGSLSLTLVLYRLLQGIDPRISLTSVLCTAIIYVIGRFLAYSVSQFLIFLLLVAQLFALYEGGGYPPLSFGIVIMITMVAGMIGSATYTAWVAGLSELLLLLLLTLLPPMLPADVTVALLVMTTLLISTIWMNAYLREVDFKRLENHTRALRESEDRFRRLLEASPEMIAVQAAGKFLYINATGLRMLGAHQLTDIIGQETRRFIAERGQTSIASQLKQVGADEQLAVNFQQTFYRLDGSLLETSVTASTITYDGQLATLIIARDLPVTMVTSAAEDSLEITFNRVPAAIVVSQRNEIIFANHQAEITTGYDREELQMFPLNALLQGETASLVADSPRSGEKRFFEQTYRYRHKNGEVRWLWLKSQFTQYQGQRLLVSVGHDVTAAKQTEHQLALFRTVFEQAHEGIVITSANLEAGLKMQYVNPAFCQMSGYHAEELIGKSPRLLQGPLTDQQMLISLRKAMESGGAFQGETINYRKDRSTYRVAWSVAPVFNTEGRITHFLSVQRSLEERDILQQRLNQYDTHLKLHVAQQALVAELGLLAISDIEARSIYDSALILVQQVLEVYLCTLFIYTTEDQTMRVLASTPIQRDTPINIAEEPTPTGNLYALRQQEPVITENIVTERRFTPAQYLRELGIVSSLYVPLQGKNHPIGVLEIHHNQSRSFTHDDLYFVQAICNILSAFIEREHAQAAEHAQREFIEAIQTITTLLTSKLDVAQVLEIILDFVVQVMPRKIAATIMLLEEEELRIVAKRGYTDLELDPQRSVFRLDEIPGIRHMVKTSSPLHVADTQQSLIWVKKGAAQWIRSYIGAPMVVDEQCIGIINIDSPTPNAFRESDVQRLMTFASKAGIAIANARHAAELEQRVQERTLELELRHAQLQRILSISGEGICYVEDGTIIIANEALATLTGYSLATLIQRPLTDIVVINLSADMQQIWRGEAQLRCADQTLLDVGITISQFEEQPTRWVLIIRDIRQQKALNMQKSRFIANAAHELRTPILHLNTRLYLLRNKPHQLLDHLQVLEKIVSRMNRLANDLLDIVYFEHGRIQLNLETVILQNVVWEMVELSLTEVQKREQRLFYDAPNEPLSLLGDAYRLKQVVVNLLQNALTYTHDQGVIAVRLRQAPAQTAILEIHDNGKGIPPEVLPHIFEPFYRADEKSVGSGLGLPIAREIVEMHHGTITAESHPDFGTIFTVRLPLLPAS